MGVGYTVSCDKCGIKKEVLIGSGFLPPENFRDDILEGRFGLDPKEYLEEHPDAEFYVEQVPYGCSCGYVSSFSEVTFYIDNGKIAMGSHRCSQCGKRMRKNFWGSGKCWKCGSKLSMMETILWD